MIARIVTAFAIAAVAMAPAACARQPEPDSPPPAQAPSNDDATSDLRLAPGLYDLQDGTVQAAGTLDYVDLEGGFWAVIGGTQSEGDQGEIVAVIVNADEFPDQTAQGRGRAVLVEGRRVEGASIRMAGPEIEATSIILSSDSPGIAE